MCARGDNLQIPLAYQVRENAAKVCDISAGFFDVFADSGADLDHRLDHLRLDLFAQKHLAVFENFRHMRSQLAGLRIDKLEFFLDTKGKLLKPARRNSHLTRGLLKGPEHQNDDAYCECDDGRQVKPTQSRSMAVGTSYFPHAYHPSAMMTMHSHILILSPPKSSFLETRCGYLQR